MQTEVRERVTNHRTFRTEVMDPDTDGVLIVQRVTMDNGMIDVTNCVRLDDDDLRMAIKRLSGG